VPFFHKGVKFVIDEMSGAYPDLKQSQAAVEKVILFEEEKFFETLDSGLKLLEEELGSMKKGDTLEGAAAFKLYDTYGFPLDLTEMILEERGFKIDHDGFGKALEEQRARSRASWKGAAAAADAEVYHKIADKVKSSKFTGYSSLKEKTEILAMLKEGKEIEEASEGDEIQLVVKACPFYAESGGQVGDTGWIKTESAQLDVDDCIKPTGSYHLIFGRVTAGKLTIKDKVGAEVNRELRMRTRIHHTMTHVLHATLQEVLGEHIKQAGSQVGPDSLRFDFSHPKAVSKDELREIEKICNQRIRENPNLKLSEESMDNAIKAGAKAFFEDKYGDQVRVLRIGEFSIELCGGTHAESLAEAGLFKITQELSVASGVRRIVAVTGQAAYEFVLQEEKMIDDLAAKLKSPKQDLVPRVEKLLKDQKDLQKKLSQRGTTSPSSAKDLVEEIESIPVVVDLPEVESAKELRPIADDYKNQIKKGVILLGAKTNGKATVVISVTKDLADLFDTRSLVNVIGEKLGGKGGGRPDFAQVGGPKLDALSKEMLKEAATNHIRSLVIPA
jgi:alanyl-tRNA synthetase